MSKETTSAGSVLAAFALGALVGAAVALLYAPGPGEETRRRLADKAREGRERAGSAARRGSEILREQREHLSEAVDRGVEAFDQVRKEIL